MCIQSELGIRLVAGMSGHQHVRENGRWVIKLLTPEQIADLKAYSERRAAKALSSENSSRNLQVVAAG